MWKMLRFFSKNIYKCAGKLQQREHTSKRDLGATRLASRLSGLGDKTMIEQKKSVSFRLKATFALCVGLVVVVVATLYLQPRVSNFFDRNHLQENPSANGSEEKKAKEYSFTDEQIKGAMRDVDASRKNTRVSSQRIESGKSLYEIEFVSGGRVYSENVVATDDIVSFENDKGLVVSVSRGEVKTLKRLVQKGDENSGNYRCRGKTHCSHMSSCEEAKFYLHNCPGVKIDGDGNGVPCEKQWCGN